MSLALQLPDLGADLLRTQTFAGDPRVVPAKPAVLAVVHAVVAEVKGRE